MTPKETVILVMAKMALADGHLAAEEKARILPLVESPEALEALFERAAGLELDELLGQLDRYADRFFVALQAASMAQVDGRLEAEEKAFYASLLERLRLRAEDVELIETSVRQLEALEPVEPDPRIGELFELSSFS